MVFVVSPGTAGEGGSRRRAGLAIGLGPPLNWVPGSWVMPGRVECLVVGYRRVAAGDPHPSRCANPRAIVDGREGRAGPLSGFRAGATAGAIESRRDVTRISGRKAARQLQSRVQRSGGKAALACSTRARVAPGTDTSTRCEPARRPAAGRCGRTFCTSIKAALNGPHAPPPGRVPVAPLALRLRPRNARRLARKRKAQEAAAEHRPLTVGVVGRQPAGPRGHEPARRRGAHAGSVGELAAITGLRLLRLRRGRSGSGMVATPSARCGPWVVARAIPPADDPGEPSRPPPDPPAFDRASRPS